MFFTTWLPCVYLSLTLDIGSQEVDDLNAGDEDLLVNGHVCELWGLGVDGGELVGVDGAPLVNGVTDNVDDPAQGLLSHGDLDGGAGVDDRLAADQTLRTVHGDRPHSVLSQVLGNCGVENTGKPF